MAEKGPVEREIKFAGVALDHLRERMLELEAERAMAPTFEDNWVLDKDGELESAGSVLRLRTDGHGATLTLKGPARFEGRMKVRQELETRVEDSASTRSLLENLGYRLVRRYQKVREEWHLGGVTIALDHTPIGDFVEFEGDGAETVAKRCGFDIDHSERRTYLRLYQDYRESHPDSPPDMVFPDDK